MSTKRPVPAEIPADVIDGLARALVDASTVPVLLLDAKLTVIASSSSFCDAFQLEPRNVTDHELWELGRGEWDTPPLRSLLRATLSGYAKIDIYEMDLKRRDREPRRLALNVVKLDAGEDRRVWLLLTISDITDQVAAEALREMLTHEKAVLLRDVRHRVANSLQIIASVLLQSARDVPTSDSLLRLDGARGRRRSISAIQLQLAGDGAGTVAMRPYFEQLCDSLGGSMIGDDEQITLEVDIDDSFCSAEDSMALGLIVTELVINALKHAFPDQRKGGIRVSYGSSADDWTLKVSDNGVGTRAASGKPGLGTGIVDALTRKLGGTQLVSSSGAGTSVSIKNAAGALPAAAA